MYRAQTFDFKKNIQAALADRRLRRNLRAAMDILIDNRHKAFPNAAALERLRSRGHAIKQHALNRLPRLLEELEGRCRENGMQVHWAETAAEANDTVLSIARVHGARFLVKGKSMVSEEIHLNAFLARHDITAVETDLGEFIIQLCRETPSHIIVPAIHKNRQEVARILHQQVPDAPYTEDVEELTAIARHTLRRRFAEARVGISGVNMAVAETGTLVLVENEGNGRMCTSVPEVHIALMGIEKVIARLDDVPPLLRLLTGSATGQRITTYVNMITAPRRKNEKDGPREVHLILLDNRRSHILADPELRQILMCLRCGTCLNHCPVYTRIGGHAYGHVYPGPMGQVFTPLIEGVQQTGELAEASSLCGACEAVCPVKIPLPALLRRIRRERAQQDSAQSGGRLKNMAEAAVWKGWALANVYPALNQAAVKAGANAGRLPTLTGPLKQWTNVRTAPRFADRTLHEMLNATGDGDE